ncbi:MAG: HNH endonuclease [Bacteroidetes bacterium]|nr:HNH endonuclease [Bacteroidota bacterium]
MDASLYRLKVVCFYCKRKVKNAGGFTRDHVFPKSLGGEDKGNIVNCCYECNQFKADQTLSQWLQVVEVMLKYKLAYQNYSLALLGTIRKNIWNKLRNSK